MFHIGLNNVRAIDTVTYIYTAGYLSVWRLVTHLTSHSHFNTGSVFTSWLTSDASEIDYTIFLKLYFKLYYFISDRNENGKRRGINSLDWGLEPAPLQSAFSTTELNKRSDCTIITLTAGVRIGCQSNDSFPYYLHLTLWLTVFYWKLSSNGREPWNAYFYTPVNGCHVQIVQIDFETLKEALEYFFFRN